MKSRLTIVALVAAMMAMAFSGCGGKSDMMKLIEERDSLRLQYEIQTQRLGNIEKAVNALNATVDSISAEEGLIFINYSGGEATREDALGNLNRFQYMLQQQAKKIDELERELAQSAFNSDAMQVTVYLRGQLALKDRQIAQLRKELEDKNVDIARLKRQVEEQGLRITAQNQRIDELVTTNTNQANALRYQDQEINSAYVLIGTKDDLRSKGVIDRKGNLVSSSMLRNTGLAKVDIRTWREISFSAKKPKILTNMPAGTYTLTTNGDGQFLLQINDPTNFWHISNYLIIQTN